MIADRWLQGVAPRWMPEGIEPWLFTELAPVLISFKAGELLNFDRRALFHSMHEVRRALSRIQEIWSVEVVQLFQCDQTEKWLVYYPERVERALREVPEGLLEDQLGYAAPREPKSFLDELSRRWRKRGSIPHEIGLALGYPVKDVLGFMGLNGLTQSGCCGWSIFGEVANSQQTSVAYQQAKKQAARLTAACESYRGTMASVGH